MQSDPPVDFTIKYCFSPNDISRVIESSTQKTFTFVMPQEILPQSFIGGTALQAARLLG